MKIAHILTSLNIGGAERFVIDLSLLQKKNNKVKIISFGSRNEPLVQVCYDAGIEIDFISGNIFQRTKQLSQSIQPFDVIHFHSPHAMKASIFTVPALTSKKVIYTRHGADPFNSGSWCFWHSVFRHVVDSATFVSEDGSHVFHANHDWKNVDSHVIENGIGMPLIEKLRNKTIGNKIKIGSVGRMVSLKNQITLLKAVGELPEIMLNNIEVHFFGDGECRRELEIAAQNIKHAEVFFHGVVTDRDKIYSNIDILAVTSETEGLSLAIIEAMSYQIPTIASDVGGNSRLVINGQTGELYSNYLNHIQLAEIINSYINNNDLIVKQGVSAREHVESNFSLDSTLRKYQEIYSN